MKQYEHTQHSTLLAVFFGLMALLFLFIPIEGESGLERYFGLFILVIIFPLFSKLTVTIEDQMLKLRFGIGLIRKKFLLNEMESSRVVRNPWYYGWGIRLTPHGWLYNVSGFFAVEIKMKTKKKFRIGSDAPEELHRAIQMQMLENQPKDKIQDGKNN